jgi:hypothetical protein
MACGGTTASSEPVTCGGAKATLTPSGNTYNDNPRAQDSPSTTPITFDMFVYQAPYGQPGSVDAGVADGGSARPDDVPRSCPSAGLVATSSAKVELEAGRYFVCQEAGNCGCLEVRLTGGPATFVWLAGPGGGTLEVRGCGEVVRGP